MCVFAALSLALANETHVGLFISPISFNNFVGQELGSLKRGALLPHIRPLSVLDHITEELSLSCV